VISPRSSLQLLSLKNKSTLKLVLRKLFIGKLIANANFVNVTSKQEKNELLYNFQPKNLTLIENGLDFSEFEALPDKIEARQCLSIPQQGKCVLFFSRIHERKGLDLLYQAFAKAKKSFLKDEDFLLIAGALEDESIISEIEKLSIIDGLQERVFYLGMLLGDKRLAAYAAADLFVLPTKFENFGMSIAEALSAGIRVITTSSTPWGEIEEMKFGKIVERDGDELLRAIEDLSNSEVSQKEKRNMYEYIKNNFDYRDKAVAVSQAYDRYCLRKW